MAMSKPNVSSYRQLFCHEEDDTKPLITELVGHVCYYKDAQSSLHNFTLLS